MKTGKGGAPLEERCFVDVSAWGSMAELAVAKLSRGSQVLVVGRLWSDEFSRDGRKHIRLSVVAEQIELLGDPKRHVRPDDVRDGRAGKSAGGGEGVAKTAVGNGEDSQF